VRRLRADAGRTGPFDIAFSSFTRTDPDQDPDGTRYRHELEAYVDAGVTWISLGCRGRSLEACFDELAWLGDNIVGPYRLERTSRN
jgi:hypothetical protein